MTITTLEPGNRIQLPAEWAEALGLRGRVILDKTEQGIQVRPCPPNSWEEIFASKLPVGKPRPDAEDMEEPRDAFLSKPHWRVAR